MALAFGACRSSGVPDVEPDRDFRRRGHSEKGRASWYGPGFHGRHTANGEVYDMNGISAAHRTLAFGTMVEVENLDNGERLLVRINDRGPFIRGRILDLSYGAALRLEMVQAGIVPVRLTVVGREERAVHTASTRDPKARYRVQVGAFTEKRNAKALVDELRRAYPKLRLRSDDRWHRVQLEGLSESEANERVGQLARDGHDAFTAPCTRDTCG